MIGIFLVTKIRNTQLELAQTELQRQVSGKQQEETRPFTQSIALLA